MSHKKFIYDIGLSGLTQLVVRLQVIIILPIITKTLGAVNFGIWVQLMVTVGLIVPIIILGLPYTLVRFLSGEKNKTEILDGVWSVAIVVFGVSFITAFLIILFSSSISIFLGTQKTLVQILAVILVFESLNQVFWNVFRAFGQIRTYSFFVIFQTIGNIILIALTVYAGHGLAGAIMSILIMDIISFVLMFSLVAQKIGIAIPRFLKIKKYLSFSLPTIIGNFSLWVVQSSDRYFLGFFIGTIAVGYYSSAYTLGVIIMFFAAPLSFILPATLTKFYDDNNTNEVKQYVKYSIKYFLLIAIPSCFGLSILSKQILEIVSTQEIAQNSYFIVPFIAVSMVLLGVSMIISEIISLIKKNHITGTIWFSSALVNIILNLVLIPVSGIFGAAIATLTSYILAFIMIYHYSYKELPFQIDWTIVVKSMLASIVMTMFVFWFNPTGFYRTIIAIIFGALIYFIIIIYFKSFSKKEIEFFRINWR